MFGNLLLDFCAIFILYSIPSIPILYARLEDDDSVRPASWYRQYFVTLCTLALITSFVLEWNALAAFVIWVTLLIILNIWIARWQRRHPGDNMVIAFLKSIRLQ